MTEPARLVIDASRCDGHGICVLRCPELITLDQWGFAGVQRGQVTDGRTLRRARRAVVACPRGALSLVPAAPPSSVARRPRLVALSPKSEPPGLAPDVR